MRSDRSVEQRRWSLGAAAAAAQWPYRTRTRGAAHHHHRETSTMDELITGQAISQADWLSIGRALKLAVFQRTDQRSLCKLRPVKAGRP